MVFFLRYFDEEKSFYVCISGKFFGAYIKIKTVTVIKMIIMTRMRVGDGGELRVLGDDEGSQGGINHPRSDQITISTKINFSSKSTLFGGGASDREKNGQVDQKAKSILSADKTFISLMSKVVGPKERRKFNPSTVVSTL